MADELNQAKNDQDKDTLISKLMSRIDSLESMVRETADKGRIMRYESKHKDLTRKKVRINMWRDEKGNNKIVDGWKMTEDKIEYIPMKGWVEIQKMQLHFIDGTVQDIMYSQFKDVIKNQVWGEVVKTVKISDEYGERDILTVDVNGQKIDIDVRFIN